MVVTPDTIVLDVSPDISAATFERVLREANSPALAEARAGYEAVVSNGVSPAFALAVFAKESTYGKAGVVVDYETKNPGNTRTSRTGSGIVVATPKGGFVRYPSWESGWADLAYRLVDPSYVYAKEGRRTIRQIVERWAPPIENDTNRYIQQIPQFMNQYLALESETPLAEPEIIRRILPRDASNTPQRRMDWQYITVHNTGNPRPGADALMHARYLEGLAARGATEPSWQYTVDDTRIVQHLEDDQAGWHASDGDGDGNLASLGFELVEVGDQDKVIANAAWIIARKLHGKGFGVDRMRQHHDWARDKKNCPRLLRANGGAGWQRLQGLVQRELDRLGSAPAPPSEDWPRIPVTERDPWRQDNPYGRDRWIPKVFIHEINAHAWHLTGYCLSEAFAETGDDGVQRVVQYFERARLELSQDGTITRGLCGRESLWSRYPERRPD